MLLYSDLTYAINGAAFHVYNKLGHGFLEAVYQEALEIEFKLRDIPYEREKRFNIVYKGNLLEQQYIADFVCYGKIIIELKSVSEVTDVHRAQVINYLKITGLRLALLQNFNVSTLQAAERIIN